MKQLLLVVALICTAPLARAVSLKDFNGKLDLTSLPSYGAWQSVTDASQATGLAKHFWTLSEGANPIVNVGLFAGVSKDVFSAADPVRFLGGPTIAVPGSVLDWALGTNMGALWLPRLKSGLLLGYDFSRPKELQAKPNFIGVGVSVAPTATAPASSQAFLEKDARHLEYLAEEGR